MGLPSALSSSPSASTLASDDRSRLLIVSFAFGHRGADLLDRGFALGAVANCHDHVGAGGGQPGGQPETEAGVRAGDDGQLSGQVGNGDCVLVAGHGDLLVSAG